MKKILSLFTIFFTFNSLVYTQDQGTLVDFSTIPSAGTIMIFGHQDDDAIFMLPWWDKTQKFICGAMPSTPTYKATIDELQDSLNINAYGINYKGNWFHPWADITQQEYVNYYWLRDTVNYGYLANDHLVHEVYSYTRPEINKIKAKIEKYIADSTTKRIISNNNWGEYGHTQHKAVNQAVRELAVKYGKDTWVLGVNGNLDDLFIPLDVTYTIANNDTNLYKTIRNTYINHGVWTYSNTSLPDRPYKYIKVVDAGVDKSNIAISDTFSITTTGPPQDKPGSYIFNGTSDFLTLPGNNYASFTIAMWVRPDEIRAMDISKMSEYPSYSTCNRSFYMQADGKICARVSDGIATSRTTLSAGEWSHILMKYEGNNLTLYINGAPEDTIATSALTQYSSPEFILGQAQETASFFKGQILDVRLYDFALSVNEIQLVSSSNSPATYVISSTTSTGGTINPLGDVIHNEGGSRTYTITPNTNFQISDVKVDGESIGAVNNHTFSNIQANHTISSSFSQNLLTGIALNKPATAESYTGYNKPGNANDDVGSSANFWEAGPYPKWWQVDLGNFYDISSVYIRNYYDGDGRYYQYEIWGSMDNVTFTKIAEKTSTAPATDT
ncbi:MAG: calx-beta domain protein, partial [Bacteroidetes bacterium]|nr:calx-beta domain protein [Bacteroidota bacterium]